MSGSDRSHRERFPFDAPERKKVVDMPGAQPSRRTTLSAAAAAAVAAVFGRGMRASASAPRDDQVSGDDQVVEQLRALEQQYAARLGVFARNTGTGRVVSYR